REPQTAARARRRLEAEALHPTPPDGMTAAGSWIHVSAGRCWLLLLARLRRRGPEGREALWVDRSAAVARRNTYARVDATATPASLTAVPLRTEFGISA